jgi:hypothetical protein
MYLAALLLISPTAPVLYVRSQARRAVRYCSNSPHCCPLSSGSWQHQHQKHIQRLMKVRICAPTYLVVQYTRLCQRRPHLLHASTFRRVSMHAQRPVHKFALIQHYNTISYTLLACLLTLLLNCMLTEQMRQCLSYHVRDGCGHMVK